MTPEDQGTAPTAPLDPAGQARRRLPANFGAIFWGLLVTAFAVVVGATTLSPRLRIDPVLWVTGGLLTAGVALVVIGILAAVRRAG